MERKNYEKELLNNLKSNIFFMDINEINDGINYYNFIEGQQFKTQTILEIINDIRNQPDNTKDKVGVLIDTLEMINEITNIVNQIVWDKKEKVLKI